MEEKDVWIEQHEKEESEYLGKVEMDFSRQEKALQEALLVISKKEEENFLLKEEISQLKESQANSK